jgi:hypothetical protein
MDGGAQLERDAVTEELDGTLWLQVLSKRRASSWQTSTIPATHCPPSNSDPGLDETRAMPAAP